MINRSSRQLTPIEEEVLALGLSFVITPSWIPYEEIVTATEALAHRIDQQTAMSLYSIMYVCICIYIIIHAQYDIYSASCNIIHIYIYIYFVARVTA